MRVLVTGVKGGIGKTAIVVSMAYTARLVLDALKVEKPVIIVDLEISNNYASYIANRYWPFAGQYAGAKGITKVAGVLEALMYNEVTLPLYRCAFAFGCHAIQNAEILPPTVEKRGIYLIPARNPANEPHISMRASVESISDAIAALYDEAEKQFDVKSRPAVFFINTPPRIDVLGDIPTAAILSVKKYVGGYAAILPTFEVATASADESKILLRHAGNLIRDIIINKADLASPGTIGAIATALGAFLFRTGHSDVVADSNEPPFVFRAGDHGIYVLPYIYGFDSYYKHATGTFCVPILELAAATLTGKNIDQVRLGAERLIVDYALGRRKPDASRVESLWVYHVARLTYTLLTKGHIIG